MEKNERVIEDILKKIKDADETNDWRNINSELFRKRLNWYGENKDRLNLEGADVRKAYTLLLIKIGISPDEAPVIYEDEKKIVWRAYNWCPVLEACKKGGFDTKEVCEKGWKLSVNALIQKINLNLYFSRNYEKVRPHAEYCEEMIELTDPTPLEKFFQEPIDLGYKTDASKLDEELI